MKRYDILYISSIPWDFSWHRQQEMMTMMAADGCRVLFVQPCSKCHPLKHGISQVREQIWVLEMPGLPYERCLGTAHWINASISRRRIRRVMQKLGFSDFILWLDRVHGFDFIGFSKGRFVVYDLVDEILSFGRMRNERLLLHLENRVLKNADLVISSSQTLLNRKVVQSGRSAKTVFLPNGVDAKRFANAGIKESIRSLPGPRIGFVGHIARWRLDYALIREIARLRPEWQLVFVGPGTEKDKHDLEGKNVRVFEPVSGDMIPEVVQSFDAAIIPYRTDGKTDYVFPRKACEYLAAGKAVVSTPLAECRVLVPHVTVAENAPEFITAIERALLQKGREAERIQFAGQFDWEILLGKLKRELPGWEENAVD